MDLITQLFVFSVLMTAVFLFYTGHITVAVLGLISTYAFTVDQITVKEGKCLQFSGYFGLIARQYKDVEMEMVSMERLEEYSQLKPEVPDLLTRRKLNFEICSRQIGKRK